MNIGRSLAEEGFLVPQGSQIEAVIGTMALFEIGATFIFLRLLFPE